MPFLNRALAAHPDNVAVADGVGTLTYRELSEDVEGFARKVRALGIGRGDVVALAGGLTRGLLTALHGAWRSSATVAPLNPRWNDSEVTRALKALSPRLVLVDTDADARLATSAEALGLYCLSLGPSIRDGTPALSEVEPSSDSLPGVVGGEEVAAVLLTSGSAGHPKPVAITFENFEASAVGSLEALDLRPSDRWLASLSIAHVGGLALVTRAALLGSSLVLRGPFEPETFHSLAARGEITHASLVPTMLHGLLLSRPGAPVPPTLRCLLIGGAPAGEALVRAALEAGFPISLTYGLSEATSQVATAPPSLVRQKIGSVGSPLPGVEVRIDATGELLVRGPTVAPGQASADGWLHTGDLARQDGDGHLWITGRLSDRIITGGVNVHPTEVERVLLAHPGVSDVAVVGVPDPRWGERVVAAVVESGSGGGSLEELEAWVRSELSKDKRPREIRILESLPLNPNGKVDRGKVRDLFR